MTGKLRLRITFCECGCGEMVQPGSSFIEGHQILPLLPHRGRGRPTQKAIEKYDQDLMAFCETIMKINSSLDFMVSARGWCYILEEYGLLKSDFDDAQKVIGVCRKNGKLPLDICAEDEPRVFTNVETINDTTPEEEATAWIDYVMNEAWQQYINFSFWDDQEYYIQMLVEKIDLVALFLPICKEYRIPIANTKGWSGISQRADMMSRFDMWEQAGKIPVLLYCGDHDPAGLAIRNHLRNNFRELSETVGWSPDNLIIDHFGLKYDFIEANNLTWVDNLITGSGKDLANSRHEDHFKPYVQDYLQQFGERKVEANAIVVRPEQGRQLCKDTVNKYIQEDAPEQYEEMMEVVRFEVKNQINIQLTDRFAA